MRRKKKGYLRHRSMFAFRFLGFGETTVHQMPPCHDLFAERPSFIRILSNRLAIFVVPTDIAQTLLLSDQANLSTRCLNENSEDERRKKKKKIRIFPFILSQKLSKLLDKNQTRNDTYFNLLPIEFKDKKQHSSLFERD